MQNDSDLAESAAMEDYVLSPGLGDYSAMAGCLPMLAGGLGNMTYDSLWEAMNGSFEMMCDFNDLNSYSSEFEVLKEPAYLTVTIILYAVVILLGAVGNTLVVLTVVRTRQMWTATNIFIANLALADVFVCVFDLPVSVYYQITDDWIFGAALCHVIPCIQAVVVFASTLSLTLIAVDRYLLIVCPLKRRLPVQSAMMLVGAVTILSLAAASPIAIFAKYVTINDHKLKLYKRYCTEAWPAAHQRFLYTIMALAFQHFVPLTIIGILYFFIFRRVRLRMQSRNSRKTKTTKMLVSVVLVFAIAWTPFHLYALIGELNYSLVKGRYYKFVDAMLRVFAMSSSCINPFLYGWFNENYKNAFFNMIRRQPSERAAIHKEDSDDTTRRSVVPSQVISSPAKNSRFIKILNGNINNKFKKKEVVPLTTFTPEAPDTKCPCLTNETTMPLIP